MEPVEASGHGGVASAPSKLGLKVDKEDKAKSFKVFSFANPHTGTFHLPWTSFACFLSTFAAAPLVPTISSSLSLVGADMENSGLASLSGSIFSMLAMGAMCDLVGPRYSCAFLVMLTAPIAFRMSPVDDAAGYIAVRFLNGFSVATFVACQCWMSAMFNRKTVGTVNGLAAGWGSMGACARQLVMPLVFHPIKTCGATAFVAWRIAYFVPGTTHVVMGLLVLILRQDLYDDDDDFASLRNNGNRRKEKFSKVVCGAITNYRTWVFVLLYGYCMSVELTTDNVIARYYFDHFNLDLRTAGTIAASFGMANIMARPMEGYLSDLGSIYSSTCARRWNIWILQAISGLFCLWLGRASTLPASITAMVLLSMCAQVVCRTIFGITPFVFRGSVGIISGMVGADGNFCTWLMQLLFFKSSRYPTTTRLHRRSQDLSIRGARQRPSQNIFHASTSSISKYHIRLTLPRHTKQLHRSMSSHSKQR